MTDKTVVKELMLADISFRDYLASEAMNGILSNHKCNPMVTLSFNPDSLSRMAYEIADAMLKARG